MTETLPPLGGPFWIWSFRHLCVFWISYFELWCFGVKKTAELAVSCWIRYSTHGRACLMARRPSAVILNSMSMAKSLSVGRTP